MISVIIPTYNRAKTIRESIDSVLAQTYHEIEVIVVDDCSLDNTEQIVKGIDDARVRYIRLDLNQGACVARNEGIKNAVGEYIAFQDSDDIWRPEKLTVQLDSMKKTGADVCFHKLHRKLPDGKEISSFPDINESKFMTHNEMCNRTCISTQTIMGRRQVFEEHKFDPLVRKTQDYDWGIRASRNYRCYYLNEILAEQRFQNDSISAKGLQVVKETREYFLEKYKEEFKINRSFEVYQLQVIAKSKALLGENSTEEFERIYEIQRRKSDFLKVVLSRLGLMPFMYRLKGERNSSLPK